MNISVSEEVTSAFAAKKLADSATESTADKLYQVISEKGITVEIAERALDRARMLVRTRTIAGNQSSESVITI